MKKQIENVVNYAQQTTIKQDQAIRLHLSQQMQELKEQTDYKLIGLNSKV
jgi:hypothetical protein